MEGLASKRQLIPAITCTVYVCVILLLMLVFGNAQETENSLVQVSVLFRHGERTPRFPYANHTKEWTEGFEQLTQKGKTHLYHLGQELRGRYAHLLGNEYNPRTLQVRSSATHRTLMSAAALLAGLMPPAEGQRMSPGLHWQPIPVLYVPPEQDEMLLIRKPCARYDRELKNILNSTTFQALQKQYHTVYEFLTNHTGEKIRDLVGAREMYDILVCKKWNNKEIPHWVGSSYSKILKYMAAKFRDVYTSNDFLKRIRSGRLLKEITTHMKETASDESEFPGKIFLYSGHESNLHDMVRCLGFKDLLEVDFGSCIIFELHHNKIDKTFLVKVLYYNKMILSKPNNLDVPRCGKSCNLQTFLNLVEPFTLDDWEKECK